MTTQAPVTERRSSLIEERPSHHHRHHQRRHDAHCLVCGYGVTVYREPLRCPMCGSNRWVADDAPAD